MTLASRISATRQQRGMSMTDLANLVGVTTSAVSNWEAANSTPRSESLDRVARALGVTRNYLETGTSGVVEPMDVKSILERAKQDLARVTSVSEDQIRLDFRVEA